MSPTHHLKVLDKTTDERAKIGAGWLNADGSISVVLNPCVVIQNDKNLVYTLFPVTKSTKSDS